MVKNEERNKMNLDWSTLQIISRMEMMERNTRRLNIFLMILILDSW